MASVHKQTGRPFWFGAYTIWTDDGEPKRVFRSTKTTNKKQAQKVCDTWERAALSARSGLLNEDSARKIIAAGVSDVLLAANIQALPRATIGAWCDAWLQTKHIEVSESSQARYEQVIVRFKSFFGARINEEIDTLKTNDIARFRDDEAKNRARATANIAVKVLRICFGEAERQELLKRNPAKSVNTLKMRGESNRRAFTLSEIKSVLKACGDDTEWRGLVLFGLYVGQRLGDLARLTWRAVDLETGEIAFTTKKTGRRVVLPLVPPLVDYLSSLPATDNPNAFIFPRAAAHKRTASLSNQFREILVEAGFAEPRSHQSTGKGRSSAREMSELSFHSLRHSAVTLLKASGLSDVFAREIVGHESAAISRQYTHLSTDDLRTAMQRLPDVTKDPSHNRSRLGTKRQTENP